MLRINKILVARDFSDGARAAYTFALELAHQHNAEVHSLHAEVLYGETAAYAPAEHDANLLNQLEDTNLLSLPFDPADLMVRHVVRRGIAPANVILDYAQNQDIDLIVMGTHGRRGIRHALLGSVAEEVVRRARVPVFTVRPQRGAPAHLRDIRMVLAPVDFSDHSRRGLAHARALAHTLHADLTVLHIVEDNYYPTIYGPGAETLYTLIPDFEQRMRTKLEAFYEEAGGPDVPVLFEVKSGVPEFVIGEYTRHQRADLVVMATHGWTGLKHFFLGSVAEKVVQRAACPVLTVKAFRPGLLDEPALDAENALDALDAETLAAPPVVAVSTEAVATDVTEDVPPAPMLDA